MVANRDLVDMGEVVDPMVVMQDNPWMMADLFQELSRTAGSEIAHGPVPNGASATQTGRVGRSLRRAGTNLTAAVASKNAGSTMRFGQTVNQAMTMAVRTRRPNMQRLLRLTAARAHQVALVNDELANNEQLKREMEERMAMKRRLAMLAGAGAVEMQTGAGREAIRTADVTGTVGRILGPTLMNNVFGAAKSVMSPTSTLGKITSPVRSVVDRMMGRETPAMAMGANTPAFEMSLETPKPSAPAPSAPRPMM